MEYGIELVLIYNWIILKFTSLTQCSNALLFPLLLFRGQFDGIDFLWIFYHIPEYIFQTTYCILHIINVYYVSIMLHLLQTAREFISLQGHYFVLIVVSQFDLLISNSWPSNIKQIRDEDALTQRTFGLIEFDLKQIICHTFINLMVDHLFNVFFCHEQYSRY